MLARVPKLIWMLLILAGIAGSIFLFRPASPVFQKTAFQLPDGFMVVADVARTPSEQARGLGGRSGLGDAEGMYFPFSEMIVRSFWMKDMKFSIDIVWLRDGTVVRVDASVPLPPETGEPLPTYSSLVPVDAVLELPAGSSELHKIIPGAQILPVR